MKLMVPWTLLRFLPPTWVVISFQAEWNCCLSYSGRLVMHSDVNICERLLVKKLYLNYNFKKSDLKYPIYVIKTITVCLLTVVRDQSVYCFFCSNKPHGSGTKVNQFHLQKMHRTRFNKKKVLTSTTLHLQPYFTTYFRLPFDFSSVWTWLPYCLRLEGLEEVLWILTWEQ